MDPARAQELICNMSSTRTLLTVALVSLTFAGCGGGDSVEDQERFQLDRTAATATADQIRGIVSGLRDTFKGEGIQSLRYALQSATENLDSIDMSTFEDDARDKAEQIRQLLSSLASTLESGGKASAAEELLQKMEDLASQLPGGAAGGNEAT